MDHRWLRPVLLFERDFRGRDRVGTALGGVVPRPEASSTTALRTQTTDGNPSRIMCQVIPSSREPNSCPLRVRYTRSRPSQAQRNSSDSTGTMYTQSGFLGCTIMAKPKSDGTPLAMSVQFSARL